MIIYVEYLQNLQRKHPAAEGAASHPLGSYLSKIDSIQPLSTKRSMQFYFRFTCATQNIEHLTRFLKQMYKLHIYSFN